MPKVLVTGGAGFIGSHTVDLLVSRGEDVTVLDNLQPRVHPKGKPPWLTTQCNFIEADVTDSSSLLEALTDVDRVVHFAAYQDYQPDYSEFIRVNTLSTALLFELIGRYRLPVRKVVCASSQAVAGEGLYTCVEHGQVLPEPRGLTQLESGMWELRCPQCSSEMKPALIPETVVAPRTAYAVSKLGIEHFCSELGRRHDIPAASIRYTYVQGTRNSPYNAYSGALRRFCLALSDGQAPTCYEDGQQRRDFVNVADVARANVLVLDAEDAQGVYTVGGGRATTVAHLATLVTEAFGLDVAPQMSGQFRLGDTRHTVSDINRISQLGWSPTISVEQSVQEYVDWIRTQPLGSGVLAAADRAMQAAGVLRQGKRR